MISPARIMMIAGGVLGLAGIGVMAAPSPEQVIEPYGQNHQSQAPEIIVPAAHKLATAFDHAALPAAVEIVVEEPPPDPAAAIRRYRYLGSAATGERGVALFETDGAVRSLRKGEVLDGFALETFDHLRARFVKDELAMDLPLSAQ